MIRATSYRSSRACKGVFLKLECAFSLATLANDVWAPRRGGWGIRTPEGFHPTRFPSVRHRPLGESSVAMEGFTRPTRTPS